MGVLLDTSFLVDLLKGKEEASRLAASLDRSPKPVLLPTLTLYEIQAGILFSQSRTEKKAFERKASGFPIVSFDEEAATEAAHIRAELLHLGVPKSHTDVMIAGIALARNHQLVTRDEDFDAIANAVGLDLLTYSLKEAHAASEESDD